MPLLSLIPIIPFLALWYYAFADYGILAGSLALAVSVPLGVVVTCLFIAGLKKLVLPRANPGIYEMDSVFYLRKWVSDGIMKASRAILLPLYTTLYFPPWLRMLGAKIGPRAELSTVWNFAPELVDVGEESFFADGSIIGGKRVFRGRFEIGDEPDRPPQFRRKQRDSSRRKRLGRRLPSWGSIHSARRNAAHSRTRRIGCGSPAFRLPHRPTVGNFTETETFKPSRKLYIQRAIVDACRILIPGYVGLFGAVMGTLAMYFLYTRKGLWMMIEVSPLIGFALSIYAVAVVVGLKKIVMGTFKPVIVPLWSMYVWLNEMVNGAYESVMSPAVAPFLGTPFAAPLLRAIGCKIGKHTYIETTLFSEWDLVEIGDYAALNAGAIIQNHLFEDRIMKSSYLKIGPECAVGNMAVVLYDSEMQRGASLGPLSLLMKGETLAPRTAWHGIPTTQARQPAFVWHLETKLAPIPRGIRTEIMESPEPALAEV